MGAGRTFHVLSPPSRWPRWLFQLLLLPLHPWGRRLPSFSAGSQDTSALLHSTQPPCSLGVLGVLSGLNSPPTSSGQQLVTFPSQGKGGNLIASSCGVICPQSILLLHPLPFWLCPEAFQSMHEGSLSWMPRNSALRVRCDCLFSLLVMLSAKNNTLFQNKSHVLNLSWWLRPHLFSYTSVGGTGITASLVALISGFCRRHRA